MLLECTHLHDVILMAWRMREQVATDMPELSYPLLLSIYRTPLLCFKAQIVDGGVW